MLCLARWRAGKLGQVSIGGSHGFSADIARPEELVEAIVRLFLHLDSRHRQILVPSISAYAMVPALVMSSRLFIHAVFASKTILGLD
jgi:hypothetical protein